MCDGLHDLERKIESDRSTLGRTLTQLSEALSPEQISDTVAREVRARGSTVGQNALDMAKANPAATVLVGVGLAALLAGPKRSEAKRPRDTGSPETAPGMIPDDGLNTEFDRRMAAAHAHEPRAPKLRAAINNGLAQLPETASRRVVKARLAAVGVQENIDRRAAAAARKAKSFHQRQPLSTGALAAGLGAIVASALPRTRAEDDLMGAQRDALMQKAELVLRKEIARAEQTGDAAPHEGIATGAERSRPH